MSVNLEDSFNIVNVREKKIHFFLLRFQQRYIFSYYLPFSLVCLCATTEKHFITKKSFI